MTAAHDPVELGAHVLGLLSVPEARVVEEHLAGCAPCRAEWEELRQMTEVLDGQPPEAFLDGPPDGDLVLQRALRQVRAETAARRRRRRFALAAAAAVVAAAVLGGGFAVGRATAPVGAPSPAAMAGAITLAGSGPGGVTMRATLGPAANWVRLSATVAGIPAAQRCRLLVIAKDGTQQIAGSWVVSPAAEERGVTLDGSAAVALPDVAAVAVENEAGRQFVRLTV